MEIYVGIRSVPWEEIKSVIAGRDIFKQNVARPLNADCPSKMDMVYIIKVYNLN